MGLTPLQQASSWKWLKKQVEKIPDQILRNTIMAEFRKRALREWGCCPDDRYGVVKKETIELTDWEKELLQDIKRSIMFELDVRELKREHETKEAKARMCDFIEHGGRLEDIPEDIRTPFITNLYYESLTQVGSWIIEQAKTLMGETND
jgi:hypothetical protein